MANAITERSVKRLRRHRDEIATWCDLWFEQARALLIEAFRTETDPDLRRDLAVLEDRVLLSATPIVEAVELTVSQTSDVVNGNTDGIEVLLADDGGDGISLREAVLAANEESGPVTIILGPGNYLLEIGGEDNDGRKGDLDLNADINIQGAGPDVTIIDASGIMGGDRVLHARNEATISIEGVTVTGGLGKEGAGILVDEGTSLALSDVVVTGNHTSGKDGGGIFNDEGTLELTDVTIMHNSADQKEGGGIHNSGIAILNRVTVSGNDAKDGAGIYSEGSDAHLKLTNVTISGNHASDKGGGLYANEQVEILHSTIAFNTAETGGGIEEAGAIILLKNSILAHNFHLDGITGSNFEGTIVSRGHNIDSDGTANLSGIGDQSNVDPALFRDLAFNGGTTQTHALAPASVAIDVAGLTGAPTVDQRNMTRDTSPDVGAFEWVPEHNAAPTDITLSDSVLPGSTAGATVGTLASTDPTTNDSHTYTVDDVRFEVSGDQLRLKADEAIEYSSEPTVALQISSTDSAENTIAKDFVLTVLSPPTVLDSQVFRVVEFAAEGTVVGTIQGTDPDSDPSDFEWAIVDGNENALDVLFSDGEQTEFGDLSAMQAQDGNPSSLKTTVEPGVEAEESASEEADHQSADADSRSDEDADLVASFEASAVQAAQSATKKAQLPNGSDASMPVDSWGGGDLKERSNFEKRELVLDNGFATPAASVDADREAQDTMQDEFRSGDRLSQRISLAQRAVVQPQLWQAIESMNDEVHRSIASNPLKIGATATTTAGLTAGYVVWVLRSGLLMSTAFAHLPMWRFMDPLAILDSKGTNDEDGESLQTIVADQDSADGQDQDEPISTRASADV